LLRIAFVTGASAVAASWTFSVIARLAGQVTSAFAERSNAFLVATGVLPPLTMFLIGAFHDHRGGHLWLWAGGTLSGPPKWFWLLGPASLAATHVVVLAARAAKFAVTGARRRLNALAVVTTAVTAFVVAGFVVTGASPRSRRTARKRATTSSHHQSARRSSGETSRPAD
jgi:hypothetical protein